MQNINFTANSNDKTVQGILVVTTLDTELLLSQPIGNTTKLSLSEKNIKDMGNFIAAVIRRIDHDALFESITLEEKQQTFMIMRDDPNSRITRLYKKKDDVNGDIVTDTESIVFDDIYGNTITVNVESLGFLPVDVPFGFKYTKDPVLNVLYQRALLPHDYDRKINKVILKEIAKQKKMKGDKPWSFWCSKLAKICSSNWNGQLYDGIFVSSDLISEAEQIATASGQLK